MSSLAFSCYKMIFAVKDDIMEIGRTVPIPQFSAEHTHAIINEAMALLVKGEPLIYAEGEYIIVGDLHGSIHDMFRIFSYYGYPPEVKYLFLGDYVDRGDYSVEVITFLLILYVLFPRNIILLRGNHEFEPTNRIYGFKASCDEEFGDESVWEHFNECFRYLPIACILNNETICLHGGISNHFKSVEYLKRVRFPIDSNNVMVSDIVWSDPTMIVLSFAENGRGLGQVFGSHSLIEFLSKSKLKMMIRGHECVDGISKMFGGKLMTVFSASNYGNFRNRSGCVLFKNSGKYFSRAFHPLERIPKSEANFFPVVCPRENKQCTLKSMRISLKSMCSRNSESFFNPLRKGVIKVTSCPIRRINATCEVLDCVGK